MNVTQSFPILSNQDRILDWVARILALGQNIGVDSLSLLQGIVPTQGLNPGLPHCRWILYQLSHKGSPRILEWVAYLFSRRSSQPRNWTEASCIAGEFFTNWAIREALDTNEGYHKPVMWSLSPSEAADLAPLDLDSEGLNPSCPKAVWPQENHLTSLCLNFLSLKCNKYLSHRLLWALSEILTLHLSHNFSKKYRLLSFVTNWPKTLNNFFSFPT